MEYKKIIIVTGHYGSGKTNFAVNVAFDIASKGKSCTVVDIDIVNPYFRTADFSKAFKEKGIKLIAPIYANTNLDIPALNYNLTSVVKESDYVVIDVGGDDAGATALGGHAQYLNSRNDVEMLYVINKYRYLTGNAEDTIELMRDIEKTSRLKCTGIVNNSNLGTETTKEIVEASSDYANEVANISKLPLVFSSYDKKLDCEGLKNPFPVEIYVKTIWNK